MLIFFIEIRDLALTNSTKYPHLVVHLKFGATYKILCKNFLQLVLINYIIFWLLLKAFEVNWMSFENDKSNQSCCFKVWIKNQLTRQNGLDKTLQIYISLSSIKYKF